jgi:hypothetical protein
MTATQLAHIMHSHDLHMIGVVLASPQGTRTLWCDPKADPPPEIDEAAAMILVDSGGVSAVVTDEWKGVRWFTDYIGELTKTVHRTGKQACREQRRRWRRR